MKEQKQIKVALLADHASIDFGGEAALPCHYFRILRERKIDTFLIVHERSRSFLEKSYPQWQEWIIYCNDKASHKLLYKLKNFLPDRLGNITFGFILRMLTLKELKTKAKKLIIDGKVNIIHKVIPVSPKEPSIISNMGAPVVIGPLNGGMSFPDGFNEREGKFVYTLYNFSRVFTNVMNTIFSGKLKAHTVLVANERTKNALPSGVDRNKVIELVENGVQMSLWQEFSQSSNRPEANSDTPEFVFVGRLVKWKAVDLLIEAFAKACSFQPMKLRIIGDGIEREALESKANKLVTDGSIIFDGWQSQQEIANKLYNARALVLPSLYECGGAVVLEAMACKAPVIATAWGGPTDYLNDECGFLINPTSHHDVVDGFAKAMQTLAEDPALAKKLGENGYERATQEFDWNKKVDHMMTVYRSAVDNEAISENFEIDQLA